MQVQRCLSPVCQLNYAQYPPIILHLFVFMLAILAHYAQTLCSRNFAVLHFCVNTLNSYVITLLQHDRCFKCSLSRNISGIGEKVRGSEEMKLITLAIWINEEYIASVQIMLA